MNNEVINASPEFVLPADFIQTTYDFYTWVLGVLIFFCVCIIIFASYKFFDDLFK